MTFRPGPLKASDAVALNKLQHAVEMLQRMKGVDPINVKWSAGIPVIVPTPCQDIPVIVSGYSSGIGVSGQGVYWWQEQDFDSFGGRFVKQPGQHGGVSTSGQYTSGYGFSGLMSGVAFNPLYETNRQVIPSGCFPYQGFARRRSATHQSGAGVGQAFEFDFALSGSAAAGGGISGIRTNILSGGVLGGMQSGFITQIAGPTGAMGIAVQSGPGILSGITLVFNNAAENIAGFVSAHSGHQFLGTGTKQPVSGGIIVTTDGCDRNGQPTPALMIAGGNPITNSGYFSYNVAQRSAEIGWGELVEEPLYPPLRLGMGVNSPGSAGIPTASMWTEGYILMGVSSLSGASYGHSVYAEDTGTPLESGGSSAWAVYPAPIQPFIGAIGHIEFTRARTSGSYATTVFALGGAAIEGPFSFACPFEGTANSLPGVHVTQLRPDMVVAGGLVVTSGGASGTFAVANSSGFLTGSTIGSGSLAPGSVLTANIASGAITSDLLANGSVLSGHVGAAQVGTPHLANESVTAPIIGSGQIDVWHIVQSMFVGQSGINITLDTGTGQIVFGRDV